MNPLRTLRGLGRLESGAALPLALLALLLITVLAFTLVALGTNEVTIATNFRGYSAAFYAAEAGAEAGLVGLRDLLQQTPSPTADQLAQIQAPALADTTLTFAAYSVTWANTPSPGTYQMTFNSGPYKGIFGLVTDYRITSQVTGAGGTQANLAQVLKFVQVPLFQFAIFYGKGVDLEMAPGPAMTVNGKIFSNSNIYIGAGLGGLKIKSNMATAGSIYRQVKKSNAIPYANDPQIDDATGTPHALNFDHQYRPGFGSQWASVDQWVDKAMTTFGGQVQDSAMGVLPITPPIPDLFQDPSNPDVVAHHLIELTQNSDSPALKAAKLYSRAGLRIVDGVATDKNQNPVNVSAAVTTTSFHDARENATMDVIEVDVGKLTQLGLAPANGVLYVASSANPTGSHIPAVRLVNGSSLPPTGLTVVSQNPVYVQGDYNTAPTGPSGNHPPAAVLADAITVLSNNWGPDKNNSDTKGTGTAYQRPATATTVNAAFATGPSSESKSGDDNGQVQNLVRFLENWDGDGVTKVPFNYGGSLVALWHSQQATGKFRCCADDPGSQYYMPPQRNYSYDPLFNTNPPPGTPSGIIMLKGAWSQR